VLLMDDGKHSDLVPVYKGESRPDVLQFTATNLHAGLPYRFSIKAKNENGLSEASEISEFFSCRLPRNLETPVYVSSS